MLSRQQRGARRPGKTGSKKKDPVKTGKTNRFRVRANPIDRIGDQTRGKVEEQNNETHPLARFDVRRRRVPSPFDA